MNGNRKDLNVYFLQEFHFQQSGCDVNIVDALNNAKKNLCILTKALIIGKKKITCM